MKPSGNVLTSYPPQYPHVCDRCGHQDSARGKTYPYIEHEEINPLTLEDHYEEL